MNLFKNIQLPAMLAVLMLFSSCQKWLDVQPKTELKQDELFSSQQGFNEAMLGAYVSMTKEATYGRELTLGMLSVMASDYSVISSSNQAVEYLTPVENFDYGKNQFRSMVDNVWLQQYNTIAQANAILSQIDAKRSVFTEDNFNLIKGEALGLRAYIHFDLLRLFAPAYLVKDDKKYMPYVTGYGRETTPFSTVEEILNKALADLDQAEQLLQNDQVGVSGKADRQIRMNLYAVKGLKARIYLYMGNKPLAFNNAKAVIDAKKIRLMTAGTDISLDRTFHNEHLFSLYSERFENAILNWLNPTANTTNGTAYYYTAETKLSGNIFGNQSTDIRFKAPMVMSYRSFLTPHKYIYQDLPPATLNVRKTYMPLMRISEMYYIAAESAADSKTATDYLNAVLTVRGLLPVSQSADLQTELKKEYRKEFFTEGQTFYYYKRLNAGRIDDSPVAQMSAVTYVAPLPENEKIYGGR